MANSFGTTLGSRALTLGMVHPLPALRSTNLHHAAHIQLDKLVSQRPMPLLLVRALGER
jgi:hypothetical protein